MAMSCWLCRSSQNCALLPEVAAKPERGLGRDRASHVQDVGDPAGGNAEVQRKTVRGELPRRELAPQEATGMHDGSHH
jgi:hypothetical protein